MIRRNVREAAMRMLYDYGMQGSDEKVAFEDDDPHVFEVNALTDADRAYLARIEEYIPDGIGKVDEAIEANSRKWRLDRITKVDLAILRLALIEIMYLDMPPKLVMNEAVELAKKYSTEKSYQFVNGVLGGWLQHRQ